MENQNIPYRRLRDKKRAKKGTVSASLLASIARHAAAKKPQDSESIMGHNVNQYMHMIRQPHLKENYIKWAIHLRRHDPLHAKDQEEQAYSVPSTFFKTTIATKLRTESHLSATKSLNSGGFEHITARRGVSSSPLNESVVAYMTGLREWKAPELKEVRPAFTTVPFKQRKQNPQLIKKGCLKKVNKVESCDLEPACDGSQNYPAYTSKIVRERNYGLTSSFTSGRNKASLPNLSWQMGLRYQ